MQRNTTHNTSSEKNAVARLEREGAHCRESHCRGAGCAVRRGAGCITGGLYLGRALAARHLAAHALEVLVLLYAASVVLEHLADLEVGVDARRGERDEGAADEADGEGRLA